MRLATTLAAGLLMCVLPTAAAARPGTVAPCEGSSLAETFAVEPGSAGAGNIVYTLRLHEQRARACFLSGIPGLTLLGARGQRLPTRRLFVGPAGSLTAVVVVGGGTRAAPLTARFSPDVPGPGEPQTKACEPTATQLRVAVAGGGAVVVTASPPTPLGEHGALQLTAFRAA